MTVFLMIASFLRYGQVRLSYLFSFILKKSSRELEQLVHFTSRLPPVSKVPAFVTTFLEVRL